MLEVSPFCHYSNSHLCKNIRRKIIKLETLKLQCCEHPKVAFLPDSSANKITSLWNCCTLRCPCCINVNWLKNSAARRLHTKPPQHGAQCQPHNQRGAHKSLVCVNTKQPQWDRLKKHCQVNFVNAGEGSRVRGPLTSSTLACYFGSQGIVQQRGREQPQKGRGGKR